MTAQLEPIFLPATASSPAVRADPEAGVLRLEGESYPENAFEFYRPLLEWTAACLDRDDRPFTLELSLIYLNTSSIKCMMDLLDLLEDAHHAGRTVAVRWRCDPDNERALDLAEEFQEDLSLPFNVIPDAQEG